MAVLFYALGWLAVLAGAGWVGYGLYTGASALPIGVDLLGYLTTVGLPAATPGVWIAFFGLFLVALGAVISRLDEIAYNTRALD
jgi:hypothetical protein